MNKFVILGSALSRGSQKDVALAIDASILYKEANYATCSNEDLEEWYPGNPFMGEKVELLNLHYTVMLNTLCRYRTIALRVIENAK
jgi:hypothetical protein